MPSSFQLSSSAFVNGEAIPDQYTCNGQGACPLLFIQNVPDKTISLALIMHDPDAPRGDYLHWCSWNIDPRIRTLRSPALPEGVVQGMNSSGTIGYVPPCPPSGTHRYIFDLYALDIMIDLPEGATRRQLMQAMMGHEIDMTTLIGTRVLTTERPTTMQTADRDAKIATCPPGSTVNL
jgi:Raf kinase inhibitor-like YbhB/YbcL family protein